MSNCLETTPAIANNGVMKSRDAAVEPAQMSTAELLVAAQLEVLQDDPESPDPHLVALHERPTQEVFDAATRMLSDGDPAARELGARILRELGPQGEAGRRPFSAEAVPLLIGRLSQESDPGVLRWVISALGYNGAREALGEVLRFVEHPDWRVRFHVAAALPSLVNLERIEPHALDALLRLCRDDEADTRYYALYALVEELECVGPEDIIQAITGLVNDPDEQIRSIARANHPSAWPVACLSARKGSQMGGLIGRKLVRVVRLAWHRVGEPDDLSVGPVQLVFEDGRGLFLHGRSDWALEIVETCPGDDKWLSPYDYDYDGGRWLSRDASDEPPFASVNGRPLADLGPILNEVNEVTGLRLDFDGHKLTLKTWQGEVTT